MEKTTGGMTKKAVRSVCGLLAAGLLVAAVSRESNVQYGLSRGYHKARRNLDVYSVYYKYRFGRDHCRA